MTVILRRPDDLPQRGAYDRWAAIEAAPSALDPATAVSGLADALETAFDEVADDWWSIAHALGAEPTADLGNMPACTSNLSDFGTMLAWARLSDGWAAAPDRTLLVTSDPWMFRHLASRDGIEAGAPPGLLGAEIRLCVRGAAARARTAMRFAAAALASPRPDDGAARNERVLLVYGHPTSDAEGRDGYFGDLMQRLPDLRRILHVDCPPSRAAELAADSRTQSLHSWGHPLSVLRLLGARWRPSRRWAEHPLRWLIRRAERREAGTASGAAIRWQQICQRNWLRRARPAAVAWPWENHAWERDFVRACRAGGTKTVGYQHSVVGRQMLNYSPASNPDGLTSIPDAVFCTGEATAEQLLAWGLPKERIEIGGALRFADQKAPRWDPTAPVFLALPFDGRTAGEMIDAAKRVGGRQFIAKAHPMTPHPFEETDAVRRTDSRLADHDALAGVVYAATTVGLEALIAGLPTYRFRPNGRIALDILPQRCRAVPVDAATLGAALDRPCRPEPTARNAIFAAVDIDLWRRHLGAV